MIRNIVNHLGQTIGQMELPDDTSEEVWQKKLAPYAVPPLSQEEATYNQLFALWENRTAFAREVVATLQIHQEANGFTAQQRVWLHHRLRAIPVQFSGGATGVVDLMNLVIAADPVAALECVAQIQPDEMTEPFHCLSQELIDALAQMLAQQVGDAP